MENAAITVSIITPFYNGNQHMKTLFSCVRENAKAFAPIGAIELVLVNDSPQTPIDYDATWVDGFSLTIYNNPQNVGIHQARVNGLARCAGEYVIFLDQDDRISSDAVVNRFSALGEHDVVVSNGIEEAPPRPGAIYPTRGEQDSALREESYYILGCRITSPGHCLIRKSAIPTVWCENIVQRNGADDLLLWLLLFKSGKTFTADYHNTYTHVHTGVNLSGDFDRMATSVMEVLDIVKRTVGVTPKQERLYCRRLRMRKMYEGCGKLRKLIAYALNPDIALAMWRIKR